MFKRILILLFLLSALVPFVMASIKETPISRYHQRPQVMAERTHAAATSSVDTTPVPRSVLIAGSDGISIPKMLVFGLLAILGLAALIVGVVFANRSA